MPLYVVTWRDHDGADAEVVLRLSHFVVPGDVIEVDGRSLEVMNVKYKPLATNDGAEFVELAECKLVRASRRSGP